ncbi:Nn.00g007330.m01.CDS01 [Neocucurbitaria sp. VM-36]
MHLLKLVFFVLVLACQKDNHFVQYITHLTVENRYARYARLIVHQHSGRAWYTMSRHAHNAGQVTYRYTANRLSTYIQPALAAFVRPGYALMDLPRRMTNALFGPENWYEERRNA